MIKERIQDNRTIRWCRPQIEKQDRAAVDQLLRRRFLASGGQVKNFQDRFEEYIGGGRAIATSSCMAALHMAAILLDLKPGDEVLVPALTHVATAHCIELVGGRPVFVDAHIESGNMDNSQIERHISGRTKAIVLVHYIGIPAYMRSTMDIARRHDLRVVEDCATALGTSHCDTHVGLIGDIGCFSFHVKKHLTTGGEGGMLVTKHPELAERALKLRSFGYGLDAYSDPESVGVNYRMTEMQAVLGAAQLRRMPELIEHRVANLKALNSLLRPGLGRMGSSYGLNVLLPEGVDRDLVRIRLQQEPGTRTMPDPWRSPDTSLGIETAVHYPRPIPDIAYYRRKYGEQEFPVARMISRRSITLPVGPHLWPEQMKIIADRLHEVIDESMSCGRGGVHRAPPGPAPEEPGPRADRARQPGRQSHRAVA